MERKYTSKLMVNAKAAGLKKRMLAKNKYKKVVIRKRSSFRTKGQAGTTIMFRVMAFA